VIAAVCERDDAVIPELLVLRDAEERAYGWSEITEKNRQNERCAGHDGIGNFVRVGVAQYFDFAVTCESIRDARVCRSIVGNGCVLENVLARDDARRGDGHGRSAGIRNDDRRR
jgi:hypothetical protein